MRNIVAFSENEDHLIQQLRENIRKIGKAAGLEGIENNINALKDLAKAISQYPSILGKQSLGGSSRSIDTLVDNLCVKDPMDLILHIPTKAILGQGFAVAKINLFFMLFYLVRDSEELKENKDRILEIINNNIFTLMAEEVFLSLISDKKVKLTVRTQAGYLLATVWEFRIDHGVKEFAPLLSNIWIARKKIKPVFGTMLGLSELFNLSRETDPVLLDYLLRPEIKQDELDALQEFLMGLTYEELSELYGIMEKDGKSTLSKKEINSLVGGKRMYPEYREDDPRELYRSFQNRRRNSLYRSRSGVVGPKKSIEEYIMCYLLERPAE